MGRDVMYALKPWDQWGLIPQPCPPEFPQGNLLDGEAFDGRAVKREAANKSGETGRRDGQHDRNMGRVG